MRLDWHPIKIKALYLVLAITIQTTLLAKPGWLHADYIIICDWLITIGVFITIITMFFEKGIHVLYWLVLTLAFMYSFTSLQFNEDYDFYLMRIEYLLNTQMPISSSTATWLETVNLCSVVLGVIFQSWIVVRLFVRKRPQAVAPLWRNAGFNGST